MTKTTKILTSIVIILFGSLGAYLGVQQYQKYQTQEKAKVVYSEKRQKAIEISKEFIAASEAFDNKLMYIDWMRGKGNYSQNENTVYVKENLQFLETHPENTDPNESRKVFIRMLDRYVYLIPILKDNLKSMENIDANKEALKTASGCSSKKMCDYYLDTLFLIKYSSDIYDYKIKAQLSYPWPEECKTPEEANQLRTQFNTLYTQSETSLTNLSQLIAQSPWITPPAKTKFDSELTKVFSGYKTDYQLFKAYDRHFLLSACKDFSKSTEQLNKLNQFFTQLNKNYTIVNDHIIQKQLPGCGKDQNLCYQSANQEFEQLLNQLFKQN